MCIGDRVTLPRFYRLIHPPRASRKYIYKRVYYVHMGAGAAASIGADLHGVRLVGVRRSLILCISHSSRWRFSGYIYKIQNAVTEPTIVGL